MNKSQLSWRHWCAPAIAFSLFLSTFSARTIASVSTVDVSNGPEVDWFAAGTFHSYVGGTHEADWILHTTVQATDFSNEHVGGGSGGVQYTMLNEVFASSDTNSVSFTLIPVDGFTPRISLRQTPNYWDDTQWNGGDKPGDKAEFTIHWSGDGQAEINDPLGQFENAPASISSGTTLTFSDFQIFNSDDEWEVVLPVGVTAVELDWRSSEPTEGSDLTREWVNFGVDFTSVSAIPEPKSMASLLFAAVLVLHGCRRRRLTS